MKTSKKLYKWEAALLIALCVTIFYGIWEQSRQRELSDQVIRLHVVAQSDSDRDQQVKLYVRDRILRLLEPVLETREDTKSAAEALNGMLPEIESAARSAAAQAGTPCAVSATLTREGFPTRDYDGFSLPAGQYTSLRVVLGQGQGHNWWCVVFPPLCAASAEGSQEAFEKLSDDSADMIVTEDGGYRVGFRLLELFQELREIFG